VNPRQEYALLNPLGSAALDGVPDAVKRYRAERKDRGLLLMSMLAVDR
jgi:hypothetical protein